jgi:hypothetical protein
MPYVEAGRDIFFQFMPLAITSKTITIVMRTEVG